MGIPIFAPKEINLDLSSIFKESISSLCEYEIIEVNVNNKQNKFLDFITTIVFAFGIAFEVPVATVLIVWAGLTNIEKLAKARPYVFLMAFIAGMFLTPPDVISQSLLAVPVYLLYELGIIMSKVFVSKKSESDSS